MKIQNLLFAVSIATLTSCGTSSGDDHQHNHTVKAEQHNHAHAGCNHDHTGHSHDHTGHNHNHAHATHNHNTKVDEKHDSHNHEHNEHSDEIEFSDAKAKHFGIKTEIVKHNDFNEIIKVSGIITPAQGDESVISAKSSGIITLNANAIEGKQIGANTSIGHISSQSIAGGDANETARINYEAAKRELERITPLYHDKIITEREYNQAKQTYDQAKVAMTNNSGAGSSATSNIAGTITKMYVKDGEFVEAGTAIALVSKNSKLILRADLPNKYAPVVSSIKTANFKPSYSETIYDLSKLNGKLVSNKNLTAVTPGYIPINFEFTNSVGIVPGAYAEIYLIGTSKNDCITIPVSAITEEEGHFFVYAKVHPETYLKKEVTLGLNNGEVVEILSGLNVNDEIVTKGAVLIKLSQASTVPGHTHDH